MQTFDLIQFLTMIASGSGVGVFLSWALSKFSFWARVPSDKKLYVVFALSALVSMAAYFILTNVPASTINQFTPYVGIIVTVFSTFFAANVTHEFRASKSLRREIEAERELKAQGGTVENA